MERLVDNTLELYRAVALLESAYRKHDRIHSRIYLDGEAKKNIDENGLREILDISPEKIAAHLKNNIPDYFVSHIAQCLDCKSEELLKLYTYEEILELGQDEKCYKKLAAFYVADIMKKNKTNIDECMRNDYVDMCALGVLENSINEGTVHRSINLKITKSKKSPYLWITSVPNDPGGKKELTKCVIGNGNVISRTAERFVKNVLPVVNDNLGKYNYGIEPNTHKTFRNDLKHSAEILDVEL